MGRHTGRALKEREERCGRDMGEEDMTGYQRRGKSCRRGYQVTLTMESARIVTMTCFNIGGLDFNRGWCA